jgi:hypothetical protein
MSQYVKIVVYTPKSHASKIREVMGKAGAGKMGNYSHCTFTIEGVARYLPLKGAKPFIGKVGKLEQSREVRIESLCEKKLVKNVIKAVRSVHPYEKPEINIYLLDSVKNF